LTPLTESDLVGTEDVILEGKLNQSVNAKWQPFHFILKLGGIVKKKSKDSTTPLQMIPLTDKTTCQEVHVNGKKWCFSVFTGSNTFYFEAANEDLVQSWVTMITQTAERTVMKSKNSMHFVVEAGISIGRKGEIYDLNEKAEDLFGYAPNECIGKSYIDIFPEKLQPSYKHYIESCEHDAWSVLIKTKNGEQIPVEMIVRKLPSSLFENENILLEFVRLVGSYQPVMKVPENCSLEMKEFFTQVYSAINSEYLKLDEKLFRLQITGSILKDQIEMCRKDMEEKKRVQKIYQFEIEMSKEKNNVLMILQYLRNSDEKFLEFCHEVGCHDLVNFWMAAEGYRILLKDKQGYIDEAKRIYETYFDPSSENKILFNPVVAGFISQRLNKGDPNLFKSIQKEILNRLDVISKNYIQLKVESNSDVEEEEDIFQ
jgi:PAS domain S-box-containing protein